MTNQITPPANSDSNIQKQTKLPISYFLNSINHLYVYVHILYESAHFFNIKNKQRIVI